MGQLKSISQQGTDNFEFQLITDVIGYVSSRDKTNLGERFMVRGAQNVYKKDNGNIAPREGLKLRGAVDATVAAVKSSYEWSDSLGREIPLRVCNSKFQFETDIITPGSYVWYDLLTGLSITRFAFDTIWDQYQLKDFLIFADGTSNLKTWTGGFAKIDSYPTVAGVITALNATPTAGGTNYTLFDVLTITTGSGTALALVVSLGVSNAVAAIEILEGGSGYSTGAGQATSGGTGTSCTVNVSTISGFAIKISGGGTWEGAGFRNALNGGPVRGARQLMINGTTYSYTGGEDTDTITGLSADPSASGTTYPAIQVVQSNTNTPSADQTNDFLKVFNNQVLVGSYNSRKLYLSTDTYVGSTPGYTYFTNVGSFVYGDPDIIILDNNPTGITVKDGSFYIPAGNADWYILTINSIPPISFTDGSTGLTRFVYTKVEKKAGAANMAAIAHEFIDHVGNDIVYLAQDQQVRVLGSFRSQFSQKYPSLSQVIQGELANEDFTGGALRCIGDFIHITAPATGRDWMHQTQESVDGNGNVVSDRKWHPPQVRGVARFAVIDSVTYGHSSVNPQIYEIWDTGQWHDDSPAGPQGYTSIMRMSYVSDGRRQGLIRFDKTFFEGYITPATDLFANIYYNYQGSSGIQNVIINDSTTLAFSLGTGSLGDNPLGAMLVDDPTDDDDLAKFKAIRKVTFVDCFEYEVEVYSTNPDSRWEILAHGVNATLSPAQAVYITN